MLLCGGFVVGLGFGRGCDVVVVKVVGRLFGVGWVFVGIG